MANGIWLYYTKKGNLAKIQHGQVIRQGGGFKLIFAFEDKSLILDRVLTVSFKKPGGETTPFYPVVEKITKDNIENYRLKFNKIKSTEMTYGLQDGVEYYAFSFNAPSVGITDKYGVLTVVTRVSEVVGDIDKIDLNNESGDNMPDGIADNDYNDDIVYFNGSVQLYIEPTYGKPAESSNISMTQYEALLNHINIALEEKVGKNGGHAYDLHLHGEIDAQNENTHIIVNSPRGGSEGAHDAASREYVDGSFEKSPTMVDGKLKGTTTLLGTLNAITEEASIQVKSPIFETEVTNKEYVDSKDNSLASKIATNESSISRNKTDIEYLKNDKLNAIDGNATNLTVNNKLNAENAIVTVKEIDENNSTYLQATNKGYVDKRVDDLGISKYVYSENEDKEQLKRNGSIINPKTTASNVSTSKGESVQKELDDIKKNIEDKDHFKGITDDINKKSDYDNYKPGDYCIVAVSGGEDLLYIWDEGSLEDGPNTNGKGQWVEKGALSLAKFTVNDQQMDDITRNIKVTSQHIEHQDVDGTTTVKEKLIQLDEELDSLKNNVGEGYNVINENEFYINVDERKAGIYVFPISNASRTIRYGTNKNLIIEANTSAILTIVEGNGYNAFEIMFKNGNVSRGVAYFTGTNSYLYRVVENDKLYSQDKEVALKEDLDALEETVSTISSTSLNYKGIWTSGEDYLKNDIVTYGKNLYICAKGVENSTSNPEQDTSNWVLFVQGFSGNYGDLDGTPTVDTEMSDTSTNAVQNKVIKSYIDNNTPDVSAQIETHNKDEQAHEDIRKMIEDARSLLPTVTILG